MTQSPEDPPLSPATDTPASLTPDPSDDPESPELLAGRRVLFVGRLAGMNQREAGRLVRQHGGVVATKLDAEVNLVVVGEQKPPAQGQSLASVLDPATQRAVQRGHAELVAETQFWQRLGLVDEPQHIHGLYTLPMLADLVGVGRATVHLWYRRGLLQSVGEIRRLPYFDFAEVTAGRRLAELSQQGASLAALQRAVEELRRQAPGVSRPLAELPVLVEGKQLLLRQGERLMESTGQQRFDFNSPEYETFPEDFPEPPIPPVPPSEAPQPPQNSPQEPSAEPEPTGPQALPVVGEVLEDLDEGLGTAARQGQELTERTLCGLILPQKILDQIGGETDDIEVLLDAAVEMEERGELAEAAELYRAALGVTGPDPELSFLLADVLYRLGEVAAARERYAMCLELHSDYVEAWANLGCVLVDLGQTELALSAFQGALHHHPDYPDARYHLAELLDQLDRPAEAEPHWRAFLRLAPNSPWANHARERLEVVDSER